MAHGIIIIMCIILFQVQIYQIYRTKVWYILPIVYDYM